jgi:hypothetical protein
MAGSALQAANTDANRIANLASEQAFTPYILEREAVAIALMQESGDPSFGDVDTAFSKTLHSYAILDAGTSEDGFARYKYAAALNTLYGSSRLSDIESILAPLYTSSVYENSPIQRFLASERTDSTGDKPMIARLASVDPAFKSYLQKLGWMSADFATK